MDKYYLISTNRNTCLSEVMNDGIFRHLRRNQPDSGPFLDMTTGKIPANLPRVYMVFFDRVRDSETYRNITAVYLLESVDEDIPDGTGKTKYMVHLKSTNYLSQPIPFGEGTDLWESLSTTRGYKTTKFYNAKRVLLEISKDDYDTIIRFSPIPAAAPPSAVNTSSADTGARPLRAHYEAELRDFLAEDLTVLEPGLQPWDDDFVERDTKEIGRIDLLARDGKNQPVVIELKKGDADDVVVGQLCRYMGWAKENLGKQIQVRGIIVANVITPRLTYAVRAVPNVSLIAYDVQFSLRPIA